MKLSLREKVMVICFVLIGAGYCFYTFVYSPLAQKADGVADENSRLKSQVQSFADRIQESEGIASSSQQQELMKDYQEEAIKIPDDILLPECVSYLQKSVNDSGVTLSSMILTPTAAPSADQKNKPANTTGITGTKEMKITVTVKGGYSGLRSFLLAIQKAPRLYRIDKTKLNSNYKSTSEQPQNLAADSGAAQGGSIPAIPVPTIKNEITMDVTMVTFYDGISLPGYQDNQPRVQPGKGQDNPFTI